MKKRAHHWTEIHWIETWLRSMPKIGLLALIFGLLSLTAATITIGWTALVAAIILFLALSAVFHIWKGGTHGMTLLAEAIGTVFGVVIYALLGTAIRGLFTFMPAVTLSSLIFAMFTALVAGLLFSIGVMAGLKVKFKK